MLTLYEGRPTDETGRLDKEKRTYDLLDACGVTYQRVDHRPAMDMEACVEIDQVLTGMICKNLFLCDRHEREFYLLMIPGDKRFQTRELSARLGTTRLSFADEAHMAQLLDLTPGSVSVMGLMNDTDHRVQLVIDSDVVKDEYICCHPCINTSSIQFPMADLLEKVLPAMGHSPIFVDLPW